MNIKQINHFYIKHNHKHGELQTTLTKKDFMEKYYKPHLKKYGELKLLKLISTIRKDNHYIEIKIIQHKIRD